MRISDNDRDHMPAERRVDTFKDPRLVPGVVFMDREELYHVVSSAGRHQDAGLPGDFPLTAEIELPLWLIAGPGVETIAGAVLGSQSVVEVLDRELTVVDAQGKLFRWLEVCYRAGSNYAWLEPGNSEPVPASAVRFPATAWG